MMIFLLIAIMGGTLREPHGMSPSNSKMGSEDTLPVSDSLKVNKPVLPDSSGYLEISGDATGVYPQPLPEKVKIKGIKKRKVVLKRVDLKKEKKSEPEPVSPPSGKAKEKSMPKE